MHFLKTLLSLSTFLTLACYAAPLADASSLIDVRDITEDFERRAEEFTPVPHNSRFRTATNTYTGEEVNKHAKELLENIANGKKVNGYPKEGSGFRKTEGHADPAEGASHAYHHPIKNSKTDLSHGKAGPDRVVIHKRPGEHSYSVNVAYHDPNKPIPQGTGSRNHPFTTAKVKHASKNTQSRQDKAKAHSKPAKAHPPKPNHPSKHAEKEKSFAKHNAKKAQKFGGKKAPTPKKEKAEAKTKAAGKRKH